jgi:hypothetical protein
MGHLPLKQLNDMLTAAAGKVTIGGRYAHYKHPEAPYIVTDLVILEATDEVAVVYCVEEDGCKITFVRPLKSWLESVEWHGRTVPRFTQL